MPKNLTEVDEFTAAVSVPVGTDARTAASVETPFQALANRTKNLLSRITSLIASYGEKPGILVSDGFGVVSPSNLQFGGVTTFAGMTYLNGGAYAPVKTEAGPDFNATFLPSDAGVIIVTGLSAARSYTLAEPAGVSGALVRVVMPEEASISIEVGIYRPNGDLISIIRHPSGTADITMWSHLFFLHPVNGWRRIG